VSAGDDGAIDALGADERRRASGVWSKRVTAELEAAAAFELLARRFQCHGAPPAFVAELRRAADDEARHAEVCARVAERYGGQAVTRPDVVAPEPRFGVAGPELSTVLQLVLTSCLSEGVACVFLRECLAEATVPVAHAAFRQLLSDEVRHARIGWAYLASGRLGPELKRELGRAVPALVATCRTAWLSTSGAGELPPGHGRIDSEALAIIVESTLSELVMPGFRHVGIH
jgi:hypothetical protein